MMNHFDARQDAMTRKWHYTCRSGLEIWPVGKCDKDGGHETEEAARNCYRSYLIDEARLNAKGASVTCMRCDKTTDKTAVVANVSYPLCKEHMNAHALDAVVPPVGTAFSS